MIELVLGVVAVIGGYGVFRLYRSLAAAQRYLEESGEEVPLQLTHLSADLANMTRETRALRLSLEGPLRQAEDLLRVDLMRTQDDVESAAQVFMDASREVAEWLYTFDRLPEQKRRELRDAGIGPEKIRAAMEAENWAFELGNLKVKGRETMDVRIKHIIGELARVEMALQTHSRGYR